ncbi:hypothetical protein [Velocimicrobium porci]|uniref:hypothetical protein n=1 Tax=Velocimicrobium porci TaxID=2606634 RepID=UPI00197B53F2|nr:hypothetical protein [Velocimicrobium porci]
MKMIADNNTNVADLYAYLKECFKDILQELLEAEMNTTLGYEKYQKSETASTNKQKMLYLASEKFTPSFFHSVCK